MKQTPILFSGPMVRAILDGRKTKTRRVIKSISPGPVNHWVGRTKAGLWSFTSGGPGGDVHGVPCPYGAPGDLLYVKEHVWMWCERRPNGKTPTGRQKWAYVPLREAPLHYCADHPQKPAIDVVSPDTGNEWGWRKKLGRFMPRWASRITLELTGVRVERLQEISEEDAIAEGITAREIRPSTRLAGQIWYSVEGRFDAITVRDSCELLWDSINAEKHPWSSNPWVWVLEFKRV